MQEVPYDELKMCKKPLLYALAHNSPFVTNYDDISAEGCFNFLVYHYKRYKDEKNSDEDARTLQENEKYLKQQVKTSKYVSAVDGSRTEIEYDSARDRTRTEIGNDAGEEGSGTEAGKNTVENIIWLDQYLLMFTENINISKAFKSFGELNFCDPLLTNNAKIYQIITNLALGFFIPFTIIIAANCYIAHHIGRQARRRLRKNTKSKDGIRHCKTTNNSKRLKSRNRRYDLCVGKCWKSSKRRWEGTNDALPREAKKFSSPENENLVQTAASKIGSGRGTTQCPHAASFEQDRLRTSSFKGFIHRNCRVSFSSAESLPTELTSFATNCSAGLSQSVPTFSRMDDGVSTTNASTNF